MRRIEFSPPDITQAEINEVVDTLKSGWITTGPKTKKFEREIAKYINVNRVACLSSATVCLEIVLRLLGVGEGDEVITSAYTYTASASVIYHVGAKIVLVDTAPDSYEMDYNLLKDAINEKTKAIIPVDIAGKLCDYESIFKVVEEKKQLFKANNDIQKIFNRVIVLGDSAHALGASYNGKVAGQIADFTCFSFHAVKNVTTAEGGAVAWKKTKGLDDNWFYRQLMLYSLHGQSKDALSKIQLGSWEYDITYLGYKANMTDILACIGLTQLKRYDVLLERRREIIKYYDSVLTPFGMDTVKHFGNRFSSSGHLYFVRVPNITKDERDKIIICLKEKGVPCNVHYKPLPMFTAYKNLGFDIKNFPNAFNQYINEITLPVHTLLSNDDVEYIVDSFKEAVLEVMGNDYNPFKRKRK